MRKVEDKKKVFVHVVVAVVVVVVVAVVAVVVAVVSKTKMRSTRGLQIESVMVKKVVDHGGLWLQSLRRRRPSLC